jgi:hypothetical protein
MTNGTCPSCGDWFGRCTGHSSIYGSGGIRICEECWLEEEDLIEAEGTNDPDTSPAIKALVERYRRSMIAIAMPCAAPRPQGSGPSGPASAGRQASPKTCAS